MSRPDHFMGYYRKDGKVGIRNHVIAIANCSCAIGVVDQICKAVPELVPLRHTDGCSAPGLVLQAPRSSLSAPSSSMAPARSTASAAFTRLPA